jgi:hypothetical protein
MTAGAEAITAEPAIQSIERHLVPCRGKGHYNGQADRER